MSLEDEHYWQFEEHLHSNSQPSSYQV